MYTFEVGFCRENLKNAVKDVLAERVFKAS